MVCKFVKEDAKNVDKWLEPLLFAVREVPQASTGFSPFELLYGRQPRGVLDVIKESWEEGPSNSRNEIQYVLDLRVKLHTLGRLSMENLLQAQDKQMRLYNRGTRLRQFTPGDKVLVLLPTSSSKLLAKWQGPFVVTRRVGELDYEVKRTDRGDACQTYHLNLLKRTRMISDQKQHSKTLWSPGGSPLAAAAHRPGPVASRLCGCVFTPARSYGPSTAPYRNAPRGGGAQPSLSPSWKQEKCSSGGVKGHAKLGRNRRIA